MSFLLHEFDVVLAINLFCGALKAFSAVFFTPKDVGNGEVSGSDTDEAIRRGVQFLCCLYLELSL